MICWDWCTKDHEHVYDVLSPKASHYRLSVQSKDQIEAQTGVRPDDWANYKRYLREHNLRDEEPGEKGYEKKELIKEWARSGFKEACPAGRSSLEDMKRPSESFQAYKDRLRREHRGPFRFSS